jgi:diguanylate cyclase (GGDEF)-like protein/PAS domain S-box-containing protein
VGQPVQRVVTPFGPDLPVTVTVSPLVEGGPGRGPLALAAVGSLLSALLAALLYTVARSRDRAEAAVVEATEELKGSQQRLQALVRHAADLIVVTDRQGMVTFISPSVTEMFGYKPEELLGRNALEMTADDTTRRTFVELSDVARGQTVSREIVLHRADGRAVHLQVTLTNLLDDPAVRGFVANMHDISDHKAYEALLARQAHEDHLTGLPNRVRLDEVLETARSDSSEFAVLFLDLDGFKSVNDDHGHEAGDEVLRQLANRLRAGLRPSDTLVRLGGDEFVVVAPGCGERAAADLADRIRFLLREPFQANGRDAYVGASIGISLGGPDSEDLGAVVRRADEDMYRSKLAGRSG